MRDMKNEVRSLTFEQWCTINQALCGARLELNGVKNKPIAVRRASLDDAIDELNKFKIVE